MTGDPSPGCRPAGAACSLGFRRDRPELAAEVGGLLRSHLAGEGLQGTADPARVVPGVHPV